MSAGVLLLLIHAGVLPPMPPNNYTPVQYPSNLSCGIAPIPPVGCQIGQCLCEGFGRGCHWTFVCN